MTKRHMEYAAAYVRGVRKTCNHSYEANAIENAFAALFAEFNERFRRDQFHAACNSQDYDAPTYSGRKRTVRYSRDDGPAGSNREDI
jgi:hypothetical protein